MKSKLSVMIKGDIEGPRSGASWHPGFRRQSTTSARDLNCLSSRLDSIEPITATSLDKPEKNPQRQSHGPEKTPKSLASVNKSKCGNATPFSVCARGEARLRPMRSHRRFIVGAKLAVHWTDGTHSPRSHKALAAAARPPAQHSGPGNRRSRSGGPMRRERKSNGQETQSDQRFRWEMASPPHSDAPRNRH